MLRTKTERICSGAIFPQNQFLRRPVMKRLTRIMAILIMIAATAVVASSQERYDNDLQSMAGYFLKGAEVQNIWPSGFDLSLMSRPDRISLLFPYPARRTPINGIDLKFYNGDALEEMAELIKVSVDNFSETIGGRGSGSDTPEQNLLITGTAAFRISREILQNVTVDAQVFFSGKLPDGSMVYSGAQIMSVRMSDLAEKIVDEVKKNADEVEADQTRSVVDLLAEIERMRRIMEQQNPVN